MLVKYRVKSFDELLKIYGEYYTEENGNVIVPPCWGYTTKEKQQKIANVIFVVDEMFDNKIDNTHTLDEGRGETIYRWMCEKLPLINSKYVEGEKVLEFPREQNLGDILDKDIVEQLTR